jgi:cellulose synthase/poly-beta-1,6-N-acetylglucosamine synthase-like glycosyltransferase
VQNIFGVSEDINACQAIWQSQYLNRIMPGAGTIYRFKALDVLSNTSKNVWPDFISEDGAISMELVKIGYETLWSNATINAELNPYSFKSYKRRNIRWLSGAMELMTTGRYFDAYSKFPNLNITSKTNLFFTKLQMMFLFPIVVNICIVFPIFYVYYPIFLQLFLFITLLIFVLVYIWLIFYSVITLIKIRKISPSKFVYSILFGILLLPIYFAQFFSVVCIYFKWIIHRSNKPKFFVTSKNNQKITIKNWFKSEWLNLLILCVFVVLIILVNVYTIPIYLKWVPPIIWFFVLFWFSKNIMNFLSIFKFKKEYYVFTKSFLQ